MKQYQIAIMVAALSVTAVSCRKTDALDSNTPVIDIAAPTYENSWINVNEWKTVTSNNSTVSYFTLEDNTSNSDEGRNGMLVVYMRGESGIHSLPFDETSNGASRNWYYQVAGSSIIVHQQASAGTPAARDRQFTYVVLSSDQLNKLLENGQTESSLQAMPPEQLRALIK